MTLGRRYKCSQCNTRVFINADLPYEQRIMCGECQWPMTYKETELPEWTDKWVEE